MAEVSVRRARTADVTKIKSLVDGYAGRVLLAKETVTLYESVQEFVVAEFEGEVVGCGALHVLWADLGEIRTVAVHPGALGRGVGHAIVGALIDNARTLGLARLFVLTFEKHFFGRHGFVEITAHRWNRTCSRRCCAATTRASRSSSTSRTSNRTPWATPACSSASRITAWAGATGYRCSARSSSVAAAR